MTPESQAQNSATASGVNFDVKEQDFNGNEKGIPIAGKYPYPKGGDGNAIGEYKIPPQTGQSLFNSQNGNIDWFAIPQEGRYVVTVQNGSIQFVAAPDGDLQIFNNNLGWTPTESCE